MIQKMPSPVGHALGGLTVGLLLARDPRWRLPLACAVAATLPDLDLLLPIVHRGPTHSVTAAAVAGLLMFAVGRSKVSDRWRLAAGVGLAVLLHVVFDWLSQDSTDPRGVMALWPWTSTYFVSDLDLFNAVDRRYWRPGFLRRNTIALTREILILAPVVLLVLLSRRRIRALSSVRGDPQRPSV
jgi:hypothetical protein